MTNHVKNNVKSMMLDHPIFYQIKEDNFIEASKLVAEYFELGEIRKGTYENYINISCV